MPEDVSEWGFCPSCGFKKMYFRVKSNDYICYACGTRVKGILSKDKKHYAAILNKLKKESGVDMPNVRYIQFNEVKVVGASQDKTILDDIKEILNAHGQFMVTRDSMVFTIIENPAWKAKQEEMKVEETKEGAV